MFTILEGEVRWVIKDFRRKHWLVRHLLGRCLIGREWRTLCRLQGFPGAPGGPFRRGPFSLGHPFVPGETIVSCWRRQASLASAFFVSLEQLIQALHARGLVHLDLRNGRNIIIRGQEGPFMIDFQSALWVGRRPRCLR